MKRIKHFLNLASHAAVLTILVLAFQNCQAPLNFINSNPLSNAALNASGGSPTGGTDHGQGYSGKPSVTFFVRAADITFSSVALIPGAIKFTITPSLPNGLNFDPVTGEISGTPTAITNEYKNYTITGTSSTGINTVITVAVGIGDVYVINPSISGEGLSDANLTDPICADINGLCGLKAAKEQAAMNSVNTRLVLPDHSYLEITAMGITNDINTQNSVGAAAAPPIGAKLLSSKTCSRRLPVFAIDSDINIDSKVQVEVQNYSGKITKVICGFTNITAVSKSLGKSCDIPITADGISNAAQQTPCDFTVPENLLTLTCNSVLGCSGHVSCGKPAAQQELTIMTGFNLHLTAIMNYTAYSAVYFLNVDQELILDGQGPWECK